MCPYLSEGARPLGCVTLCNTLMRKRRKIYKLSQGTIIYDHNWLKICLPPIQKFHGSRMQHEHNTQD